MNKLPIISIIGRPNVGKSTLFNRIIGRRQAITSKIPGTTRDRIIERSNWNGRDFILIDTAGYLADFLKLEDTEIERLAQEQIPDAIAGSDLILFVIDAKAGITPADMAVSRNLRKFSDKVIVVFNKADGERLENSAKLENQLGFRESIAVSSISGRRIGDLLDLITRDFEKFLEEKTGLPRLAIIGRPNVGKSTLFNQLTGSSRAIVSEIPGTTRDAIKLDLELKNRNAKLSCEIIDTAGFRRRGKIVPGVEKFSIIRTIETIEAANVVLLVVDISEGFTRGDAHLAQFAIDKKKKLIIVLNKMDKLEGDVKELFRFKFMTNQIRVAISAKNKTNFDLLVREIVKALD